MDTTLTTTATSIFPPQKRSRRDDLIRVAREEFSRHGYTGASVVSIAERAGIRKSSLFHHFATKQELYNAAIQQLVHDVMAPLSAPLISASGFDARFSAAGAALRDVLVADVHTARLLVRVLVEQGEVSAVAPGLADDLVHAFAQVVQAGIDEGTIRAQDTNHAARMLIGVICFPFARLDVDATTTGTKPPATLCAAVARELLMPAASDAAVSS